MLKPTKVCVYFMQKQVEFGAACVMYNKALHLKSHLQRKYGIILNLKKEIKPLLAISKKSIKYQWVKQCDSIALQQFVINLHLAFDNYFNPKLKAKYPKFKLRHGTIKLPELKPIKPKIHRKIVSIVKSITVSMDKKVLRMYSY